MDARLVAADRVAIDHEELLFRIAAAENVDQHAAELPDTHARHLLRGLLGIGRQFGRGERAQQRLPARRIDLLVALDGPDGAVERAILAESSPICNGSSLVAASSGNWSISQSPRCTTLPRPRPYISTSSS